MTPEEKAKEILIKYISIIGSECEHDSYCDRPECNKLGCIFCCVDYAKAKTCSIICVDEILDYVETNEDMDYWQQVKEEIEKL